MSKDPAFLFYPSDASLHTQFMNRLERGAYFDLVKSQRMFHGFTAVQLRKVLGRDYDEVWPALELVLKKDDDGLYYIDWVRESLEKRANYSKKQSERVSKRWNNDGNTAVLPQRENENENEIGNKGKKKGAGKGKGKSEFTPPTLDDVEKYFLDNGFDRELAYTAFKYYADADPPWTDSNGRAVKNWKGKMISVWMKERNRSNLKIIHNDKPRGVERKQSIINTVSAMLSGGEPAADAGERSIA